MIRFITKTIAVLYTCLFLVAPHQAQAQNTPSFTQFVYSLEVMHLSAMQFCDENPNIMPADALAHASPENDVFEMACVRALDGRDIANSNWRFINRVQPISGGAADLFAMLKDFNLEGQSFSMLIGHRKIKRFIGSPDEQSFYVPFATMLKQSDSGSEIVFEFINPQTPNWNTPSPEQPDFSVASKRLGLSLDAVWRGMIKQQFAEGVLLIPETR